MEHGGEDGVGFHANDGSAGFRVNEIGVEADERCAWVPVMDSNRRKRERALRGYPLKNYTNRYYNSAFMTFGKKRTCGEWCAWVPVMDSIRRKREMALRGYPLKNETNQYYNSVTMTEC